MSPRITLGAVGVWALSAVIITPGIAAAKPVTGNVSCTLTGTATISPGLPLSSPGAATKKVKTTTTFTGTLSNCTGTQQNTKKGAQIDGGTIVAKAKTTTAIGDPLGSCAGLASPTAPTVLKAKVTFTSGGVKLTNSKADLTVGAAAIGATVQFPASGPVKGGAFKGQTLTAIAILDKGPADLVTTCVGGAIDDVQFQRCPRRVRVHDPVVDPANTRSTGKSWPSCPVLRIRRRHRSRRDRCVPSAGSRRRFVARGVFRDA